MVFRRESVSHTITNIAFESIQSEIFPFFSWLAIGMLSNLYIIKQRKEFTEKQKINAALHYYKLAVVVTLSQSIYKIQ